jgi:hypothetical protein
VAIVDIDITWLGGCWSSAMEPVDNVDVQLAAAAESERKRVKRALLDTFKDKTKAAKYAKAFVGEGLEERGERLFCVNCNRYVPFNTKAAVTQHCEGQRKKGMSFADLTDDKKQKVKHYKKKLERQAASASQNALERQVEEHRQKLFARANGAQATAAVPCRQFVASVAGDRTARVPRILDDRLRRVDVAEGRDGRRCAATED